MFFTHKDVEIELKTSSDGNIQHWCGQGGGVCIMAVLSTHIQEVPVVVVLGMIVNALLREVLHCRDHPLHVGELVLHPATGISLKFTIITLALLYTLHFRALSVSHCACEISLIAK